MSEEVVQTVLMWSDRSGQILKPGWKRGLTVYRDKTDHNLKRNALYYHDLVYIDLRHHFILTLNQIHHFQLNFTETDYFSFFCRSTFLCAVQLLISDWKIYQQQFRSLTLINTWSTVPSQGHMATTPPPPSLTGLQLHGSSSASKLLFFSSLAHCMLTELTANRANSASRRASAHSAGSEPPSAVNPDTRVLSKICLNFDRKMSFSRPHWTEVGPTVKR